MTPGIDRRRILRLAALLSPVVLAASDTHQRTEVQEEFDDVTARAVAILEVVKNLEDRARAEGHTLHPDIIARRVRIQTEMDGAEKAISQERWDVAHKAIQRAGANIDRLEKAISGR